MAAAVSVRFAQKWAEFSLNKKQKAKSGVIKTGSNSQEHLSEGSAIYECCHSPIQAASGFQRTGTPSLSQALL